MSYPLRIDVYEEGMHTLNGCCGLNLAYCFITLLYLGYIGDPEICCGLKHLGPLVVCR